MLIEPGPHRGCCQTWSDDSVEPSGCCAEQPKTTAALIDEIARDAVPLTEEPSNV